MKPSECKSCGAPIVWARTEKGHRIPLDPGEHDDGNLYVDEQGIARHCREAPARRSHFVSCPHAARHRRPRRPSGPIRAKR